MPYWGTVYFVRPDEPVLQANATNIQRADVSVAPITLADFQLLTGPKSYDALQAYLPQNAATYSQTYRLAPSRSETFQLAIDRNRSGTWNGILLCQYHLAAIGSGLRAGQIANIWLQPAMST